MQTITITQNISLYYSWLFVNINKAVAFASILQLSKRLYKSFLDHWLAALIRIFFGDYVSSFTSAYFSSLSYSWKRAEFPCHLAFTFFRIALVQFRRVLIIFILLSASCYFISQKDFRILTKILGFVRQNMIRTQKNKNFDKIIHKCFTQTNCKASTKSSRFVWYLNCSKFINENFMKISLQYVSTILLYSRLYFDGEHKLNA